MRRGAGALGAVLLLGLSACATREPPAVPADPALAPSPGAPQVGVYFGRLPCADCAGITAELVLLGPPGFRYRLRRDYAGPRWTARRVETEGEYVILRGDAVDPDATVFQVGVMGEPLYFLRVDDDELRLLDRELRPIASRADLSLRRVRPR